MDYQMTGDDMVFNKKNGVVTALGYKVNSSLLQGGSSLPAQRGGGLLDMAVPAGLIILKEMADSNTKMTSQRVIGDNLINRLLDLARMKKRRSHDTRGKKPKKKNKTRKK